MAFVFAAKVSEIPPGRVKTVEIGDEDVALCNVGGEFHAIANDGPKLIAFYKYLQERGCSNAAAVVRQRVESPK